MRSLQTRSADFQSSIAIVCISVPRVSTLLMSQQARLPQILLHSLSRPELSKKYFGGTQKGVLLWLSFVPNLLPEDGTNCFFMGAIERDLLIDTGVFADFLFRNILEMPPNFDDHVFPCSCKHWIIFVCFFLHESYGLEGKTVDSIFMCHEIAVYPAIFFQFENRDCSIASSSIEFQAEGRRRPLHMIHRALVEFMRSHFYPLIFMLEYSYLPFECPDCQQFSEAWISPRDFQHCCIIS